MSEFKPKISILLPAYKSEQLLRKVFIPSFFRNTVSDELELIIYDNGGNGDFFESRGYTEWMQGHAKHKIKQIGDGKNVGLNKALNECAKVATGEYFYLPHTDMYLLPGWDLALLNEVKNLPETSYILTSRSIEKASHIPMQLLKDFGTNLDNFRKEELEEFFKEEYKDKGIVTGCRMPMFFHRKLLEKLENYNFKNFGTKEAFDSNYFSYATDNEMIINSYQVGVRRFWICNQSVVYHLSGHSNKQQTVDKDSTAPYDYLREKWKKFGYNVGDLDTFEQSLFPWNIKIK